MSILDRLKRERTYIPTDQETFASHIKMWFPIAIIIGLIVGTLMSLFFVFTIIVSTSLGIFHPLIAMGIGGLVITFLVQIGFEKPSENGLTYVINQKHKHEPVPLNQTQEFVSAGISIGSGLPVGREGPAVIIGSAVAGKISEWRNIKPQFRHEAIVIGSAAATGALFQAPFGSAVFAAEVPYKEDSDEPMLTVAFLASVISAITMNLIISYLDANWFEINLNIFRIGNATLEVSFINTIFAFILGVSIGLIGRTTIGFYHYYKNNFLSKFKDVYKILIGLAISLVTILIGLIIIPDLYLAEGISSFEAIGDFIGHPSENLLSLLMIALIVQIIATVAVVGAGMPGGIFSPSLAIGAISGIIFSILLNFQNPELITAWAIVGMSASHASTTKTPIASILLVLEITGLPNLIIPIIIANISAYLVTGHRSLYEGQIRSREAAILKELRQYDQFEEITVEQIMTRDEKVIFALPDMKLEKIREIMIENNHRTLPVLDHDVVVGIISLNDVNLGLNKNNEIASDSMTQEVISVRKDMNAREALYQMLQNDVERAPVVNKDMELEGIVTLGDILMGHQKLTNINKLFP